MKSAFYFPLKWISSFVVADVEQSFDSEEKKNVAFISFCIVSGKQKRHTITYYCSYSTECERWLEIKRVLERCMDHSLSMSWCIDVNGIKNSKSAATIAMKLTWTWTLFKGIESIWLTHTHTPLFSKLQINPFIHLTKWKKESNVSEIKNIFKENHQIELSESRKFTGSRHKDWCHLSQYD